MKRDMKPIVKAALKVALDCVGLADGADAAEFGRLVLDVAALLELVREAHAAAK